LIRGLNRKLMKARLSPHDCWGYDSLCRLKSRNLKAIQSWSLVKILKVVAFIYTFSCFKINLVKVKIKLCLCFLNWTSRHEGVVGEWKYGSTHCSRRHQMEVSGQLHFPASLPPGKEPLLPIVQEAGWAPEPVWTRLWGEKWVAPTGTRTSDYPVRSPELYDW